MYKSGLVIKLVNIIHFEKCELVYLPMLLWQPHNHVDLVTASVDDDDDNDLVAMYLGYYGGNQLP